MSERTPTATVHDIAEALTFAIRQHVVLRSESEVEVREALEADIARGAVSAGQKVELSCGTSLLGANNRRSAIVLVTVRCTLDTGKTIEKTLVIKEPHHFCEPQTALRASVLQLGPTVYFVSESVIIEDLLPSHLSWRNLMEHNSFESIRNLGPVIISQYMKMIEHETVHAFDVLRDHLFVLGPTSAPEIRWIDWGRPRTLPAITERPDWRVILHFKALVELLIEVPFGAVLFKDMLRFSTTMLSQNKRTYAVGLLSQLRADISTREEISLTDRIQGPRWRKFFADIDREF